MISDRTHALLDAAATVFGGLMANPTGGGPFEAEKLHAFAVDTAYALLTEIERREKAHYKSQEVHSDDGA